MKLFQTNLALCISQTRMSGLFLLIKDHQNGGVTVIGLEVREISRVGSGAVRLADGGVEWNGDPQSTVTVTEVVILVHGVDHRL